MEPMKESPLRSLCCNGILLSTECERYENSNLIYIPTYWCLLNKMVYIPTVYLAAGIGEPNILWIEVYGYPLC